MTEEKKGCGGGSCLLYGCLALVAGGVLLIVLSVALIFYAVGKAKGYVADAPAKIMILEPNDQEIATARERAGPLHVAVEEGKGGTFTLTAKDINTLIASEDDFSDARGRVFMRIEDGVVSVEFSVPWPGDPGAFINGEADIKATTRDGVVSIFIKDVTLNGRKLPGWIMDLLRNTEILGEMRNGSDPQARAKVAEFDRRVKSLTVEGNTMVITLTPDKGGGEDDEPEEQELPK